MTLNVGKRTYGHARHAEIQISSRICSDGFTEGILSGEECKVPSCG